MRVSRFLQTPFISYEDKNMLYIGVEDWDFCNPYLVEIFVDSGCVYSEKIFASEFSAMLPCYGEVRACVVRLTPFEDLPTESEYTLNPPKHLQIPLLYSSHEDLGYCAYIEKLHYECYEYLKKAMELCLLHDGFKYMIEHYWWLDAFDSYAKDEEKRLLKQLFSEKRIELNAIHSGVHTSWANSEQLVRQMYFGCIEAKEKYGVSPKCAFYTDLSGASSSIIDAYTKMGIKYVGFFANSFRNCPENDTIPPIFWWENKTGEARVLLWNQRSYRPNDLGAIWCDTKRQYNEGDFYFDTTKSLKTEKWLAERISRIDSYGYDIFPICFYDDREMPTTMLLTVCEEMNKKWKHPKFRMEIPSAFMSELEERFGDKIPTLKGEISDQWADFATIAPNMMAKKRQVMRASYDAELLSAIDSIINKTEYDAGVFRDAYFQMSEFDEHCWATSSKHPQAMHRHNIEKVKKEPIDKASEALGTVLDKICPPAEDRKISIISTTPRRRKNHIRADKNTPVPKALKHQILPCGDVITEPIELDGVEIKSFDAATPSEHSVEIAVNCFETDFYRVEINPQTKKIVSLIDKKTGEEYIDKASRFEFAQFIYCYAEHKTDPNLSYEVPKKLDLKVYEGELAYIIAGTSYEEQSGATVSSHLTFYKHERVIDVDLAYKNAAGLIGDFYDRYKKNYFFAFPFKLENPRFYTGLAVGEKNESEDALPLNANDFSVADGWVAVENETHGAAIYTRDMPVFHLGSIKFNRFKCDFSEKDAHVFLYASSNRCNNLIYTSLDECQANYHLSILPYSGKHEETVPSFSEEKERELIVSAPTFEDGRLIKLSRENIKLVSLKKAEKQENAIVLRFTETKGVPTDAEIELFFELKGAVYVTNDERELEKIPTDKNTVRFHARPYSYTAIKVFGDFNISDARNS